MRIAQIVDVEIVADAGAVGGVVIGSKHGNVWQASSSSPQYQRNQMSFRVVAFAQIAVWISPGGIEIAQTDRFQAISDVVVLQHLLDHPLATPIGIDRIFGMRLINRNADRFAKNRRCG